MLCARPCRHRARSSAAARWRSPHTSWGSPGPGSAPASAPSTVASTTTSHRTRSAAKTPPRVTSAGSFSAGPALGALPCHGSLLSTESQKARQLGTPKRSVGYRRVAATYSCCSRPPDWRRSRMTPLSRRDLIIGGSAALGGLSSAVLGSMCAWTGTGTAAAEPERTEDHVRRVDGDRARPRTSSATADRRGRSRAHHAQLPEGARIGCRVHRDLRGDELRSGALLPARPDPGSHHDDERRRRAPRPSAELDMAKVSIPRLGPRWAGAEHAADAATGRRAGPSRAARPCCASSPRTTAPIR